jgi:hypothetical protein
MSYSDRDYQKLAEAVVADFVSSSIPLEKSVIKMAQESGLNVNETRRLVEATNVTAHLTLFSKMAEHKYVEFDIVDPEHVCDTLFADPSRALNTEGEEKLASYDLRLELPDERWEFVKERARELSDTALEKVAMADPVQDKYAGVRAHYAIDHAQRVEDELHTQLQIAYIGYQEKVAAVKHAMSFIDAAPADEVQSDMLALRGVDALPVLQDVFGDSVTTKTASVKHVILRKEHELVNAAIDARKVAKTAAAAVQWFHDNAQKVRVQ